jgi:pimeloyl-ACP methyl ester carboxylesterase
MSETNNSQIRGIKDTVKRQLEGFHSGMTAKTTLPNGESHDLERTYDERFERGDMFCIIKSIRKARSTATSNEEKTAWEERLKCASQISDDLTNKLDILNNQFYNSENLKLVQVEFDSENYQIPVRHYSLSEMAASQDPPLIILGGVGSGHTVTKSTAEAFALQYPGRDVYVVSYPDSPTAIIPKDFPQKIKGSEGLSIYSGVLKKTIENLLEGQFDLVGISMGAGIGLNMIRDEAFADRVRNLILISPTNIQPAKNKLALAIEFSSEYLHGALHPKEFLRVGRLQPKQEPKARPGTGFIPAADIVKRQEFTPDDLSQIEVGGRVMFVTGEKDRVIAGAETLRVIEETNEKRKTMGKRLFEPCLIVSAHHNVGDAYAAGIVRLIRETDGSSLPERYPLSKLENSTAKVLIRENQEIAPVADQVLM